MRSLRSRSKIMRRRSTSKKNGSWRKMRRFVGKITRSKDTSKERKRKLEEMTTSNPAPDDWKKVINKLEVEKAELKAYYGKEILKLKLDQAFGSSSDEDD